MKIFTQVNRSQGMIRTLVGLKSRITLTKPLLTMLALLMVCLFGVNESAWGACTYETNYGGTSATANGQWYSYKGFGDITICSPNSDLKIVSVSMTVSMDGSGWDKGFKGTLKTNDGTNLKSNFEVDCGSSANCSANVNKSGVTRIYFSTSNTYSKSRTVTISNIVVTYEYAGSLSLSSSSHDLGNVNIDDNASQDFTVSSYNLSGTPTVTPSGDTNGFSTKLTANTGDCPKTWKLNVKYAPTCIINTTTYTQKKCTVQVSLGGKSQSMIVSATPTLRSQTVNWELGKATSLVAGTSLDVAGFATSTSNIDGKPSIYYTSSDESVIDVDEDGHTLIANEKKAGYSATITAHQNADCKYGEATADQVFTVTAKDRPKFTLYVGGVATEATSANLKVGDVVEIHYVNAPNLQVSGGSSTTFTHTKNTTDKIVTVTATGICTNGELTLSESGNTLVEKRTVKFTFNITKNETSLSSLLDVNDFYVGNSVYAATAYDFANGTAYNTNNSEVDVHFSSTDENVINLVNGQIKALKAGKATITISQTGNNKWTGASVQQTITVKKRPAVFTWNVGSAYTWNQSISNPFTTNNHDTEITCVSDDTNVADYVDGKVVIYNVTGTAHFTLHQDSSDVWAEKSKQYTVTVSKPNNHVELVYSQSLFNSTSVTSKSSNVSWSNGMLKLGADGATNWDDKYAQINFEGVPNNLNFTYYTSNGSASRASSDWFNAPYFWVDVLVTESTGDKWYTEKWKEANKDSHETASIQLPANAKAVKIHYSGNFSGYISGLTIEERREVKPHESADVNCGTANHGENPTEVKAILEWYNVKPLTCWITSDHPEEAFELVTTSINSKLDTYKKNEEITVRGKHNVPAGTYTGTLHVSNGIESTTFNLTTTTTKQTPSIVWKNELSPMSVGDVVADAASAGSATVHYTVDGTYLTLNEQGAVVAENATDENGVDLIAYVEEDETWKAASETIKVVVTNLLKQTITWNDKLSFKFTGTKVIDLTATSSSGVEITYELSGTGNYATLDNANKKLTVTGIGSSLYLTAKTVDNAEYYPAARTKNINSRDPNATCPSEVLYEEYNEQKLSTGITSFSGEWVELTWDAEHPGAEPGLLSCKIKAGLAATGKMAIEEYVNGWRRVGEEDGYDVSLTYMTISNLPISRNATKVRIGAPVGCTLNHYVDEIKLTQAKYCELSKSKLDFGTVTMGTAPEMSFTVHYSNLAKSLDIELENAGTQFTVDKAYIGDDCGEHGTVTVTVTYNAANYVASESTNLVISNTEYTKKVSLTATVQKASQTITWDPTLSLNTTDVVAFDAVTTDAAAATGVIVKYAVTEGSDVATVTEDGHLTIIKNGTVKVKAYAEGNSQYEDATDVVKTFTISKVTPTITKNPTINAITLPATLSNVAIGTDATAKDDKNNAVTGSFAWQTSTTKVLSGANDYVIVFTPNQPTGKDWYNEVVYNISVTGNKGDQSITWTRDNVTSQPCSTPTTFDASSNRGLAITYESDDESIARVDKVGNEYHLVVLTSGTVHITAKQSGNGDYNAAEDVTKTITLTREQPVITTPPTADTIFTDNHLSDAGLSGGEGKVNGVHADGIFAWKNGDIQPEYGEHSYTATFTPSPAAWYYPAECQVSVTVNKHPHSLSWDYAGGTIYVDKDDLYFGGATSSVELDNIYYTTSNAAVAEVDAEQGNKLVIHGKGTIEVIARSEGNTNYYAAEQRRTLTILPLATTVMANPAAEHAITYGQALNATAVVGGTVKGSDNAELQGTWTWNNGAETLNAGNDQVRGVTFTPNDSHWYATATSTATVNVNKATPTETANYVEITYGTAASSVTLSGSGNGTWSWNDSRANETLDAGSYSLDVRFTPNDGDNYNVQNTTVQVTVNPATPDLAWTKAPTECLTTDANVNFAAASEASTGAISYEIVNGTGVSIDATSGVLTITETGTVTIQATIAATQNYESRSITTSLAITPPNVFTNATGNGKWDEPANWSVEVPQEEAPDVVVSGELVIDGKVTVGDLTIQPTGGVTIVDDGKLTVTGQSNDIPEYGDIHVMDDGALELESTAVLEVRHFTLDAKLGDVSDDTKKGASGQVDGTEQLSVNGEVYFDLQLDPGTRATYGWYTFTVPFEVNVVGGIYRLNNDGSMTLYKAGKDFIVMRYDEAKRARGEKGWVKLNSGVLHAGIGYNITVDDEVDQNVLRFVWNKNNTLGASYSCPLQLSASTTDKAGWNGLGNGTLTHTQLNGLDEEEKVQMYDHESNTFMGVYAKDFTYAVGTAFFYQAQNTDPLVLTQADGSRVLRAPQREGQRVGEFQLSLTEDGAVNKSDLMYVSADEEATGEYRVGRDLLKMSNPTEANVAQMWSERNGLKLCDIEVQLMGSSATCELGLYAPKAGSYTLDVERAPENTMLYLTYNGRAIWNLTYSPYVFDLTKGTTEGYGLKMYVMQVTTDLEESGFSDQNSVRKVLIDDVIYIVTPEGKMYDITGKSANY